MNLMFNYVVEIFFMGTEDVTALKILIKKIIFSVKITPTTF